MEKMRLKFFTIGSNQKRAQAALEFLTTYGWAFLVILIMIGTLAYFGILNPGKYLPNRCTMGSEVLCEDYQVTTAQVRLRLKNSLGEPITIPAGGISIGSEGASSLSCTTVTPTLPINAWSSGGSIDFTFSVCANSAAAGLIAGEKAKINVTINYYTIAGGANYQKQIKGEVLSSVT